MFQTLIGEKLSVRTLVVARSKPIARLLEKQEENDEA
jgi:hypothetical protein